MFLESTPFISSSTSFWYQFLHFRLTYTPSLLPLLFHQSGQSLSFTPGLKPTRFTSCRTAFTGYCPDRSFGATRFSFLVFLIFFVYVPCARLSSPSRQLSGARKYSVSYRIVSYRIVMMLPPSVVTCL